MTTRESQIEVEATEAMAAEGWEPKLVAFICNWCTQTAADTAGEVGLEYPPNIRLIRVPCAGRLNPLYIIKSFQQGIDGVLVAGCETGHCHYRSGNLLAQRRFALLKGLLEHVGVEPERLHFSLSGGSEAQKFARIVTEAVESVRALGPAKALVRK